EALGDPPAYQSLGEKAAQFIATHYELRHTVRKLYSFYCTFLLNTIPKINQNQPAIDVIHERPRETSQLRSFSSSIRNSIARRRSSMARSQLSPVVQPSMVARGQLTISTDNPNNTNLPPPGDSQALTNLDVGDQSQQSSIEKPMQCKLIL